MDIILSIKPIYADAIFRGDKFYEFRRKIWNLNNFNVKNDKIFVYSTAPVSKIIGEFNILSANEIDINYSTYYRLKNWGYINE